MTTTTSKQTVDEPSRILVPAWDDRSALGAAVGSLLPVVLLAVSWVVWGFGGMPPMTADRVGPAAVLSVALLILRAIGEVVARRVPTRSAGWTVGWVVHAVLLLLLVMVNPYACIYAFSGYIDAERFLNDRILIVAVVVTAMLCAIGQSGGPPVIRERPAVFIGLVLINVLIAGGMMRLAMERERNVQARLTAAEELSRIHRQNVELQESLMAQARERGAAAERERLSRDIHDTVAQGLVAVITQLESVPDTVDEDAHRRIDRAEQAARSSLAEARRAVQALASPLLDERDLPAALSELSRTWSQTQEIPVRFEQDGTAVDCPHSDVLIKITQEALSNVGRHSGAQQVAVTLTLHCDEVRVDVHDDGRGFAPDTVRRGHGLTSMQDRVNAVGGSLTVETAPSDGCTISAAVPR